jgi:hypothetical protein
MKIPRKVKIGLVILGLLGLVAAWQGITFWLATGYSRGTRTGVVRKVSVSGPPYCKNLRGELVLQTSSLVQNDPPFEFTVDDYSDKNQVVQDLKKAERDGVRVTLTYRFDRPLWWRCNSLQYYVEKVEH